MYSINNIRSFLAGVGSHRFAFVMGTPCFPKGDKSKQKTSKVVSATAASRTYTLAHFGAIQYTVAKTVVAVGSMAAYVFSPLS